MRVGVDMDGVLADFYGGILMMANSCIGGEACMGHLATRDNQYTFNIRECVCWCAADYMENTEGFFYGLKPFEDSIKGMNDMHDAGIDIVVITAIPRKSKTAYHEKFKWMKKYFPWFEKEMFIGTNGKWFVNVDAFIDDGDHNIASMKAVNPNTFTTVLDAAYNRTLLADANADLRVKKFTEFSNMIIGMNNVEIEEI